MNNNKNNCYRLSGLLFCFCFTSACDNVKQTVENYVYDIPAVNFNNCYEAGQYGFQTVTTVAGVETIRYYLKIKPGASATLIHFHGNADSACYALGQTQAGFDPTDRLNLVYVEYPGYSGDAAKPNEVLLLNNAEAIYQKIATDFSLPIIVTGHSIGANIATWVAKNSPVDGLVLISSFPDMQVLANILVPGVTVDLSLHLYSASDWAPYVLAPVMVIAPENDQIVPVLASNWLWAEFNSTNAEFLVIPQVDHNSVMLSPELYTAVNRFMDSIL